MKLHDANLARLMLNQARLLEERLLSRRRHDLDTDPDFAAVVAWRLLELVNRAGDVAPATQAQYPGLPWREFQGLRKMLLHGQQAFDSEIIWNVLTVDLPKLLPRLEAMANGLVAPVGDEILAADRARQR